MKSFDLECFFRGESSTGEGVPGDEAAEIGLSRFRDALWLRVSPTLFRAGLRLVGGVILEECLIGVIGVTVGGVWPLDERVIGVRVVGWECVGEESRSRVPSIDPAVEHLAMFLALMLSKEIDERDEINCRGAPGVQALLSNWLMPDSIDFLSSPSEVNRSVLLIALGLGDINLAV